jgi:drug/metabolite transporter (DMT)-like permease
MPTFFPNHKASLSGSYQGPTSRFGQRLRHIFFKDKGHQFPWPWSGVLTRVLPPGHSWRVFLGPAWMILWNCLFTTQMLVNRWLKVWVSADFLVWVRCLIVLLCVLVMIRPKQLGKCLPIQLARGLCVAVTLACSYHAYRTLPTYTAALLGSTGPLFSVFLAWALLREKTTLGQWLCTAVGFMGIALVYYPWQGLSLGNNEAIALLGNVTAALAVLCGRVLAARSVPAVSTLFFSALVPFVVYSLALFLRSSQHAGPIFAWGGGAMPLSAWIGFFSLGFLAIASQTCYLRALAHAPVAVITPLEYFRLCLMIPLAYLIFGDVPPKMLYVGLAISVGACLVLTRLTVSKSASKN